MTPARNTPGVTACTDAWSAAPEGPIAPARAPSLDSGATRRAHHVAPSMESIPQPTWERLARQRIYFGHQSVGYNILTGVSELLAERRDIRLPLVESADPDAMSRPGLIHSKIGSNTDAKSKLQAFANLMAAGAGDHLDAAFFKLCYVDINHQTDVPALVAEYAHVMESLAHRFPRVRFLHVTAPLTSLPTGPKQTLKKLLGRPLWGYEHNRRRELFNQLMRDRFGAEGRLFDIAAIEARRPDGARETFTWAGASHPAMYPGYTSDSGHLGAAGRRVVARAFLPWLAEATS